MKKCMWGLLVGLTLGGVCRGRAQIVLDTSAPASVPYCRTFTVTNTFLNNGDTFGGLVVTQEFPQASFQYIAGSTTARVNGAVALTGAAADPATNAAGSLVWALTNLAASAGIDHLLITELYYNTPLTPMADNQWIELFNPTTNTVSMAGWSIRDALPGQTDALPAFDFAPGEFVVIAGRTNAFLAANPGYSGRVFEVADGTLGSSLNDFADGIFLINAASQTVDAVSYAASTAAFNPPVPGVAVGHSIARDPANEDTDTRSDWIDCATPTPGTGRLPVGVPHGGAVSVVSSYRTICGAISGQFLTTAVYQQPPGAAPATASGATFVTLLPGTLNVRKTPAVQAAGPGDIVSWDLTISNDGLGDVVNGVVVDQLGGGLQFQSFSVAPTNAAPIGQTVVWDASVLPALARLAPGSQVVVHVTAEVVACDDLWNRADATWGCQAGEICGDTAARGASALAGINFVRRPPALTGGVSPGSPISVDYCAGTPLTIALTNGPGAGPAVGIHLQAVLPTAYEIVGDAVSNGWIQIGTLNGGQVTNVTVTLRPAGTPCALLPARQVALLLPAYTDFCGTPFAPPALPFQFQLSPKPSAAVAKIEPSAITADAAPSTVTVQLTYANFHNTAVEIDDFFPQNAAIFATNVTQGGVLAATNIVWQIPAGTLEGSGVWTATYALGVSTTNPCVVPSGSFLDPVTAQLTDCHACASTATGSSDAYHIRCAPAAACGGSGGTGSCHYVSAKYGPSLTEVCHAAPLYSVFTDFGGLSAPTNWNGLVFTSDLAGGQGLLSSTGSVSVVVDGHDVTAGAAIVVTNGTLRIQLDGLSASGCPAPNAIAQNLTIGWEVSVTNAGRVTDYSSLSLPACGSSSDYWT